MLLWLLLCRVCVCVCVCVFVVLLRVFVRSRYLNLFPRFPGFDLPKTTTTKQTGVGVAKQRKAIVDGLRSSIVDFDEGVSGSNTKDIITLLLVTQYFDTIRDVGSASHCKTTFIPTSKTPADEIRNSMLQAKAGE